jgi:hypothetical protein
LHTYSSAVRLRAASASLAAATSSGLACTYVLIVKLARQRWRPWMWRGLFCKAHVRWRAGYTLAVLDRVFSGSAGQAELMPENFSPLGTGGIPRGRVTVEVLLDPPGHVRLPIADDEIIDRAVAVQPLAGRRVTLLTFDTGQSTRARSAGLEVRKLSQASR